MIKKPKKVIETPQVDKKLIEDFINNADKPESEKVVSQNRTFLSISIKFSQEESDKLDALKKIKGLTRIGVIRLAIAELYNREKGQQ
jgi:hypothetical protein